MSDVKNRLRRFRLNFEDAFTATKDFSFSPHERSKLFGFVIEYEEDIDHIRGAATVLLQVDVETRVELVESLHARLVGMMGTDPKLLAKWFETKLADLDNRTPKDVLRSGMIEDLKKVEGLVRRATG